MNESTTTTDQIESIRMYAGAILAELQDARGRDRRTIDRDVIRNHALSISNLATMLKAKATR